MKAYIEYSNYRILTEIKTNKIADSSISFNKLRNETILVRTNLFLEMKVNLLQNMSNLFLGIHQFFAETQF